MVVVNETDMSVTLTVSILNGTLAPGAWVEVEFTTSDMPSYNTSAAMCEYIMFIQYSSY